MKKALVRAFTQRDVEKASLLQEYINNNPMLLDQLADIEDIVYKINLHNMLYGTKLMLNKDIYDGLIESLSK